MVLQKGGPAAAVQGFQVQWLRPCCLLRTMHVACCVLPGVWHHCSPTKPPAIAPPLKLRQCTPQVTLRCGGRKPLLIKSPVHTARVALLLKLFPRARFVYVHRDPLTTFCSAAHMVRLSSCVRPLLGGDTVVAARQPYVAGNRARRRHRKCTAQSVACLSQCLAGKHLLLASVWEGCATRVQL